MGSKIKLIRPCPIELNQPYSVYDYTDKSQRLHVIFRDKISLKMGIVTILMVLGGQNSFGSLCPPYLVEIYYAFSVTVHYVFLLCSQAQNCVMEGEFSLKGIWPRFLSSGLRIFFGWQILLLEISLSSSSPILLFWVLLQATCMFIL